MGPQYVAVVVLKQETLGALEHAKGAAREPRGMLAGDNPPPSCLHPDHLHFRVVDKMMEEPHRIAAAADAGDEIIGQPAFRIEHLFFGLLADDGLKVPYDQRKRVRTEDSPENIMGGPDIRRPVAHRLVDRVFERPGTYRHLDHVRTEESHPEDIERLAYDIVGTHIDLTLKTTEGRTRCGRNSVLPRPCLGN